MQAWEEFPNNASWWRSRASIDKYASDFAAIFYINRYGVNTYSCSVVHCQTQSLGYQSIYLLPSGFTWRLTSACMTGDVIQVWIKTSSWSHWISHSKAALAQLFLSQHRIGMYWRKRHTLWLCDTVRQTSLGKSGAGADMWSSQWLLTSLRMSAWPHCTTSSIPIIYFFTSCRP